MNKLQEHDIDNPTMCIEPGRYIVGDAAYLLARVNTVKQSYRKFVGVDAGFNTLLRPTMYGSYHHILLQTNLKQPPPRTLMWQGMSVNLEIFLPGTGHFLKSRKETCSPS